MKVLVTGANGFVGRNLCQRLAERPDVAVVPFTRATAIGALPELLDGVDFVFHLAGANRPADPSEFRTVNQELTETLCAAVVGEAAAGGRRIPIVLASSQQVQHAESDYARSKLAAEQAVLAASRDHGLPVHVFRLPNVFGKWCRPNYNSVVATFCWNLARGLPIEVHDPAARLTLVYIDDVVERFIELMDGAPPAIDSAGFAMIQPRYTCTVGEIAGHIRRFRESRAALIPSEVGAGFLRALYATYLSYLPEEDFVYPLRERADAGGRFVEVLKARTSGEVSCFTVAPGITRSGHYHDTRMERFLVLSGLARVRFRHDLDGRTHEVVTSGERAEVVETVPGWAHEITNIGSTELVVALLANALSDAQRPDPRSPRT